MPELESGDDCSICDSDSDGEDDDSYDSIKLKRGAKVSYSVEDRLAVTPAVLALLDWRYLAPKQSSLYLQGQTKKNGDFLKHVALDFNKLKELIKPTIRDLAGRCVNGGNKTHQRFFWAAYDVVRKRRANHVQSWRRCNHPRDLIYGGKKEFIQMFGNPWANSKRKKKRRKRRRSVKSTLQFTQRAAKQQKPSHDQAIYICLSNFYKYFISLCSNHNIIFIHLSGGPSKASSAAAAATKAISVNFILGKCRLSSPKASSAAAATRHSRPFRR